MRTLGPDTGWWLHHGKRWHVVQKQDGSVECNSEDGHYTAAYGRTWESWKQFHNWRREEKGDKDLQSDYQVEDDPCSGFEAYDACATEGCDNPGTVRFEGGGVGSDYCAQCAKKIQDMNGPHEGTV